MADKTLPPDPENMNNDRSDWAEQAILRFQACTGADRGDALCDLLGDLMHWCDRADFDFNEELERARMHYEAETIGDA